jgi:hypothetical protein
MVRIHKLGWRWRVGENMEIGEERHSKVLERRGMPG